MAEKDRKEFFNILEEHSKIKLMVLNEYIKTWMRKVVLNQFGNSNCLIVDTFAGTGLYDDGNVGSPLIIIREALDFIEQSKKYPKMSINSINLIFIESDTNNYNKLKLNIETYIGQRINDHCFNKINNYINIAISNSTHEEFIENLLRSVNKMMPAFFFIDPFKFSVPFKLNEGLLRKYDKVELLFNLITEELSRFFEVDKIDNSLKMLYGINDTSEIKKKIKDKTGKDRINVITDFYKKRLIDAGASYTLNFDIQRETGHYKMSLVYATKNINGFDTMKMVLNKLSSEESSGFEYLVDKSGGQMHLVFYPKEEIIIKELSDYIYKLYNGKRTLSKEIKSEIKKHPYIPSSYYTKAMKNLTENNKIESVIKTSGAQARKNSFPDDSYIQFKNSIFEKV